MQVGLHASHEQFPPSYLLRVARQAEAAGFGAVLSSDHLAPWSRSQGNAGFAWTWLGAVAATTQLPMGIVTAPVDRYHPVIVAQAIATVAELAPGRLVPSLGSGQALNEHVSGRPWPDKGVRNARLAEAADVIRRLLAGETVDHDGLVRVHQARIFSRPAATPPLFAAALTPETAAAVAAWSEGLITVHAPRERLARVIDAYRSAGDGQQPVHVQLHLSWAQTQEQVEGQALEQWRTNAFPPGLTESITTPEEFDRRAAKVTVDDLRDSVVMSTELGHHADVIAGLEDLGVDRVYLHQVGTDQERFVEAFGGQVLSQVSG